MNPQDYFKDFEYFQVHASEYDNAKDFHVTRPSSLNHPKDYAVMFIMEKYMAEYASVFEIVDNCLVFWPKDCEVPKSVKDKHAVVLSDNPHLDFCRFFNSHNITNFVQPGEIVQKDGYMLTGDVSIGEGTKVFPYVYMNGNITIGKNCYIGSGAKLIGNIQIGDNVLIKENTVLGCDGLTTDREPDGRAASMPQFGGIVIGDDVQIGANTIISRGAIDNTVISAGCKIDNNCSISHNNLFGENVFMVEEAATFGSVTVGKNTQISGNSTIRQGLCVGTDSLIGVGAVVTRNVKDHSVIAGNPAKPVVKM